VIFQDGDRRYRAARDIDIICVNLAMLFIILFITIALLFFYLLSIYTVDNVI